MLIESKLPKHIGRLIYQRKEKQRYLPGPHPPQASTQSRLALRANTKTRMLAEQPMFSKI